MKQNDFSDFRLILLAEIVTLIKSVNASAAVNELLLAREERVAL